MTFHLTSDTAEARKARGVFFTPPELCRYGADWAIRSASDEVLEPSCGEAAFLLAAGERLDALAALAGNTRSGLDGIELHGIELHRDSAWQAEAFVRAAGPTTSYWKPCSVFPSGKAPARTAEASLMRNRAVAPSDARVLDRAYVKQVDVLIAQWSRGPELLVSTKTMVSPRGGVERRQSGGRRPHTS